MTDQQLQDLIPEDAVDLNASCVWCGWQQPILDRTATVSHACYALNDVLPVTRQPAIRVEWRTYRAVS